MPRIERMADDNDLLWLLCCQIETTDAWDTILHGLNEKGQNDIIGFVHSVLYESDEEE